MVIRNADGTIFKLNSPNPVMKEQKTWNGYILHNMDWKPFAYGTTVQENPQENKHEKTTQEEYKDTFLEELEKNQPPKKEEPKVEPPKPQPVTNKKKINIPTTLCHCLPAKEENRTDYLYDEVYKSISYDNPFVCEIVITEETDVFFECWTTVENIDIGSILYPKNKMKRWWKVTNKEFKTGGYLLQSTISEHQPAFQD